MSGSLYLAWRYLASHPFKSVILIASITLIVYLPLGLRVLVDQSETQLTARADATPLLIGARGSPTELVLNSLYFGSDVPARMGFGHTQEVAASGHALSIPLYVRFRAQKDPIVGTSLDYFDLHRLRVAEGRQIQRLGECVVGAGVAARRGLAPGDHLISSTENVFDLAGVYPLKMRVVGVLAASESADDDAIFTDLKTTWVIQGLAHGHEDLSRPEASARVLEREGRHVVGNASVVEYNEITPRNADSFHFHGDPSRFPITAVVAVPPDAKRAALLMGRYEASDEQHQILRPREVMDELLGTILTVQNFVVAAFALLAVATLGTAALVFALSIRLRRREIETMVRIGGSRRHVAAILAFEVVVVLLAGVLSAVLLTGITSLYGPELIRAWIA